MQPPKARRSDGLATYRNAVMIGLGWLFVALGIIGAMLPVMPTTCFMIAALACFVRGSPRLAQWLLAHPRFGRSLRAWQAYRAIPGDVKWVAVTSIAASWLLIVALSTGWIVSALVGGVLMPVVVYIVTRPGLPPPYSPDISDAGSLRAFAELASLPGPRWHRK